MAVEVALARRPARHGQRHRALPGELRRVAEDIEQDLSHAGGVGDHLAELGLDGQLEAVVVAQQQGDHGVDDLAQQLRDGEALRRQTQPPRLDTAEVEDIGDQHQQVRAGHADPPEVLLDGALLARPHLVDEQVAVPEDRVERRAKLVAHVGEEGALRLVAALRLDLHVPQLLGQPPLRRPGRRPLERVADRPLELPRAKLALDQEVLRAGVHRRDVQLELGLTGQEDDRHLAAERPDLLQQLDAGPRAEPVVEQAHVPGRRHQRVHGLLVGLQPAHVVILGANLLDHLEGEDVIVLVVVDEQHLDRPAHLSPPRSRRSRTSTSREPA